MFYPKVTMSETEVSDILAINEGIILLRASTASANKLNSEDILVHGFASALVRGSSGTSNNWDTPK
jgi:hypothetical protein